MFIWCIYICKELLERSCKKTLLCNKIDNTIKINCYIKLGNIFEMHFQHYYFFTLSVVREVISVMHCTVNSQFFGQYASVSNSINPSTNHVYLVDNSASKRSWFVWSFRWILASAVLIFSAMTTLFLYCSSFTFYCSNKPITSFSILDLVIWLPVYWQFQ